MAGCLVRIARLVRVVRGLSLAPFAAVGCSSGSNGQADAHAAADAARDAGAREDGIPDATVWEANVPDALLSIGDAFPDVLPALDPLNCIPPGTASNAAGVGGYCSPFGGQCGALDGSTAFCTADFGAPPHLWFCTIGCTTLAQCGNGPAMCVAAVGATACVPTACAAFATPRDASLDGSDASTQHDAGSTDGATDAPETGG